MRKEDRERVIKLLNYLESEVDDHLVFANLSWETYQKDKEKRRNVERWIENIVMSSIDIAKVLLAAENRPIPDSSNNPYGNTFRKAREMDSYSMTMKRRDRRDQPDINIKIKGPQ